LLSNSKDKRDVAHMLFKVKSPLRKDDFLYIEQRYLKIRKKRPQERRKKKRKKKSVPERFWKVEFARIDC